ncbi:MAG: SDR family NAD(P)-dependent oxidoreductase [Alphaproteobacteria bacterium]|nr:SDR family NAD(P)-dependent oxidoreductase [Alphaproteobacteria bacterium]NCQ88679.1 SDR family NAD(P)-dependent oxidoreductase [Alphaproteobacteria bacterium]NCT06222.1 SDR family NAD(P)-dependent oxidoreductase [Alphaproteobacteria bacterium]
MDTIQGKYIWIIGASSGIGADLARELSERGATLALSARSQEKLQNLQSELGQHHLVMPLDVCDANALNKAAQEILKKFPRLDSAISMAAIYNPGAIKDMDINEAHNILNVNLNGMFNFVHAALPIFRTQKSGQIVLCGSVAGYRGLPNGQPYSASKAAVINLAESLRAEEKDNNIDVKVINPGFVKTPMTDQNDFEMPMMIDSNIAAKEIADGLIKKNFEIHFPKKFTFIMKVIRLMPSSLYFIISNQFKK